MLCDTSWPPAAMPGSGLQPQDAATVLLDELSSCADGL